MAGQIGDFFYKANERNLKLYLEFRTEGKHQGSGIGYWILTFALLLLIPTLFLYLVYLAATGLYNWMFV